MCMCVYVYNSIIIYMYCIGLNCVLVRQYRVWINIESQVSYSLRVPAPFYYNAEKQRNTGRHFSIISFNFIPSLCH